MPYDLSYYLCSVYEAVAGFSIVGVNISNKCDSNGVRTSTIVLRILIENGIVNKMV